MIMHNINRQKGFTLVEVLIAVALLSIAVLGAAAMQIASTGGNSNAIRLTTAVAWNSDTLETLMSTPYADIEDVNIDGAAGLDNTDVVGSLADGTAVQGDYTVFWNVVDDYPIIGTKTIRVITQRRDKGILKSVTQDFTMMEPI